VPGRESVSEWVLVWDLLEALAGAGITGGFDWGHRNVIYNHSTYISHSTTFTNRNNFYHGRASLPAGMRYLLLRPKHGAGEPHGGAPAKACVPQQVRPSGELAEEMLGRGRNCYGW